MKKIAEVLVVASLCGSLASPVYARECQGVQVPNTATVDGHALVLNGMGIREATVFQVDVYVAALYLEHTSRDGNQIAQADERKRLVLNFVREVSRDDIVQAWNEGFQRNAGGQLAGLRGRIDQLNGYMTAMAAGQHMSFTYVPATGLEVNVNGQRRGVIEGAEFARAFFSIWLGSNPPNPGLRTGLLGGPCQ